MLPGNFRELLSALLFINHTIAFYGDCSVLNALAQREAANICNGRRIMTRRTLTGTILLGGMRVFADGFQSMARLHTSTGISSRSIEISQRRSQLRSYQLFNSADAEKATYLVVGDGDLSYSAQLATELNHGSIHLIASVLEDQETHHSVYRNSQENTATISGAQQSVLFGIDATQLSNHFSDQVFDRIIFNFPHWRGKANNRYNRKLLSEFLGSAAPRLKPNGEIHVALCRGQGGAESMTSIEWNGSWTAAAFAAEHGLLLRQLVTFKKSYNLSSHRGVDRPFNLGDNPLLYVFGLPNGETIDESLQIAFRHELRIELQRDEFFSNASFSRDNLEKGDVIPMLLQQIVSDYPGIDAKVPLRKPTKPKKIAQDQIAFLVVYKGASFPITRPMADEIRARLESIAVNRLGLRVAKAGRMVSKPFPYPLLGHLVEDFLSRRTLRDANTNNSDTRELG